ncbi:MAG: hypothetical protein EOP92_33600 [Lysobacteraceae bacterium]|nr:MAG: hypothetical protein EOP92_33600 [Xanthomonadaceae bacterium]
MNDRDDGERNCWQQVTKLERNTIHRKFSLFKNLWNDDLIKIIQANDKKLEQHKRKTFQDDAFEWHFAQRHAEIFEKYSKKRYSVRHKCKIN